LSEKKDENVIVDYVYKHPMPNDLKYVYVCFSAWGTKFQETASNRSQFMEENVFHIANKVNLFLQIIRPYATSIGSKLTHSLCEAGKKSQ
jgi:hypothetical protein